LFIVVDFTAVVVRRCGLWYALKSYFRFNFYEIKDFVTPNRDRKNAKILKKIDRKIWKFGIFDCIFVISK